MCKECECECVCCEEEISKEELIEGVINEVNAGGCAPCNLGELYDIAYSRGQRDVAKVYKGLSEDILEEE